MQTLLLATVAISLVGGPLPLISPPQSSPPPPSVQQQTAPPPSNATPSHQVAWGLYNSGFPGNIGGIQAVESQIGKRAAIVMWYKHWGGPWNTFNQADIATVLANGSVPMVTWMSDDYTIAGYPDPATQSAYSNQQIADGNFDGFIRSWADGLRDTHTLILLRLDSEMNGNWFGWSPGLNGNTPATYMSMWRHVHDIFVSEGAMNVQWVWSPNVDYPGATPFEALYPGDAYVDWVALDGYNWGHTNGYTPWQTFSQVFGPSYQRLSLLTHRPVMVAETGSVEVGAPAGQSKASWIGSALSTEIPRSFPRLSVLIWFDQNNSNGQDFRIESSDASLGAFASAIQLPYYTPAFPAFIRIG